MTATSNVTVRLTDEEKERVKAAAQAEDLSSAEWMARQIRRATRARQIAAYTGPDADTRTWQGLADDAAEAMMAFTAAEAA